jgi:cupin 2 domain-containing protein
VSVNKPAYYCVQSPFVLLKTVGKIMAHQRHNLFDGIPSTLQEEFLQTVAESGAVRIERIVSDGHATPQGEWYDQGWDEWVLLVSGEAILRFDDNAEPLVLKPGDHVMIPAGYRHRVEWTDTAQKTVWLAVHIIGS